MEEERLPAKGQPAGVVSSKAEESRNRAAVCGNNTIAWATSGAQDGIGEVALEGLGTMITAKPGLARTPNLCGPWTDAAFPPPSATTLVLDS